MNKNLSTLINRLKNEDLYIDILFDKDTQISALEFDSRKVVDGTLFFALPGTHVHGNTFISSAIKNGAVAIVFQDTLSTETIELAKINHIPLIKVSDSRFAMAPISDEFYDSPSKKLVCIGVTGTEGKSSTVSFIWQLLNLCNKKAGFISTVQYSLGSTPIDNPEHQTTPEAPIVQKQLYQMVQNGCEYAVIESSSHGLSKKTNRLGNVLFDLGIFMNVTQEHLEFHGTLEQYKFDKANLFRALDTHNHIKIINKQEVHIEPLGIICLDDKNAQYFCGATTKNVIGFSMTSKSTIPAVLSSIKKMPNYCGTIIANNIENNSKNVSFSYLSINHLTKQEFSQNIKISVPGVFNVYNTCAAAIATKHLLSTNNSSSLYLDDNIIEAMTNLQSVKGRMTAIDEGQDFEVIVDYAHTPSSFMTIFPPIRERCKGKIICLFGSGGERDTQKRPIQGKIADDFSDIIILTDEDPRGEEPLELLKDIAQGIINKELNKDLFLIPDRPTAIRRAFSFAQKNDIVLLLGKSHENSIIYKDFTLKYDEISEAKKALNEKGFTK